LEPLSKSFDERLQEIEAYLDLLDALQRQIQAGPPHIGGAPVTAQQQRILYSSVYLQLYNLVEATATWCVEGVAAAAATGGIWTPGDLSDDVRREWVRTVARTHTDLSYDNRLQTTLDFFTWLVANKPVEKWGVEKGGGGNWDDGELEAIAFRLGCTLQISQPNYKGVKQHVRDQMGVLVLVRTLRNKLAHGSLSFTECGENVSVSDLRDLKDRAAAYLREVVQHFQNFIDSFSYLQPAKRPVGGP
jgi:MAE_28990/MAE_18760-like HEPN